MTGPVVRREPLPAEPAGKCVVLVDGYSSGAKLPAIFAERGWSCVHVSATAEVPPYYQQTFDPDWYVAHFAFRGDVADLAASLAKHRPAAVVPGTESGVIVADLLADALGLPGNDPRDSRSHRDKYEMHNRLKQAGLRSMDHFLATDFPRLVAWAASGAWPVVLKPPASAGTDSVTFCADAAELERAFGRMFGAVNQLGERNDAVLAQRFLSGQEYFINGISGGGKHVITEIWRTDKIAVPGAGMIYDRSVLLDPTTPQTAEIVEYVHAVLTALGVRWGAHHTELMVGDDGPTLIECAARLSGGLNRAAAGHAVGISMLDLLVNLVVEGESYVRQLAQADRTHRHPLWQVQFISDEAGTVAQSHYAERLARLRSETWLQKAPIPGERVSITTDLFTSPGLVFMSHPDENALSADHAMIRAWERDHRLLTVSPTTIPEPSGEGETP